ncbi:RrF2 family transcriptional regulator [Deinococcus radiopugnans]|uniref:Rrf2 family nitric oxide-sensitive transcriptional repressor n=1 Tax=Deinococcus radiopugnans ATCC 19172 TaxID=585398 RepID=A0A5C4XFW1_9DEIO|nr:Rrf2 family transcriptional regulator [Deinococcus radiopugnans]MBB6017728.1 Rrf2 family nitric oxide-sensitive transcriptional repressor [Deinococcus radiopugnans ATCC 19172]QLG10715.1 Rrf2 family transcriptional regulator [Deinococcus sp. D7000]TNM62376.1 Rrf2 family transcriptional regulator [Deinococcus radiopugnans ATCC 19172]
MQLTRFTDVSLRVLMHLARLAPGQSATTQELATLYNVPYNHLNKAVHHLSKAGWVAASRGRGGGLRLAAAPGELRVGTVVRSTEPPGDVIDCVSQACPLRFDCALKRALDTAKQAFYTTLDGYTLADVAGSPALLALA